MSRLHIGRFNGTDVWEGPCEGCVTVTRIVYDESAGRYLCSSCLSRKDLAESGIGSYRGSNQSFPMTVIGKSNGKLPVEIMVNS